VRYLKSGFWPARRLEDLAQLDGQYADWRDRVANVRVHATGRFPEPGQTVVEEAARELQEETGLAVRGASSGGYAGANKWRVDLARLKTDDVLRAHLPAMSPASSSMPAGVRLPELTTGRCRVRIRRGAPAKGRAKVENDVAKIARNLAGGVCQTCS
jgi:hypothetical protein